jgi:hypothetical protein
MKMPIVVTVYVRPDPSTLRLFVATAETGDSFCELSDVSSIGKLVQNKVWEKILGAIIPVPPVPVP